MASKNVSLPFKTIDSVSVSAAVTITSSVTSLINYDAVSLQFMWSGPLTGSLDIQGSLDYKTGLAQGLGGPNPGTWTSITQSAPNTLPITVASGSSQVLVNMSQIAFPWLRTQYVHGSGSGILSGWVSSKSWSA